jgi:alkanesulfonate monooxygenase SsuD/methylene tetrahydromethanopterin reductase-like flavin-dependent oxidoreductase (luciferase family)
MRIGIASAQLGRLAEPAAVRAIADAAEAIGYSSVWVRDRLPAVIEPWRGQRGPAAGDAGPDDPERALDPFAVMATVAACTTRVRVGASVLVAPWYPPVVLARALSSLDVLSEGRLTVGLGTGSPRRPDGAPADPRDRGRALEHILDVLDAHWADGAEASCTASSATLRPVQRPRPPLLLAASTAPALDRVARRADGWMPAAVRIDAIRPAWERLLAAAAGHGRDPERLALVVRADIHLTAAPIDGERRAYAGSLDQVVDDVVATRAAGAHEIILALAGDPSVDEALCTYAQITEAVGAPVT